MTQRKIVFTKNCFDIVLGTKKVSFNGKDLNYRRGKKRDRMLILSYNKGLEVQTSDERSLDSLEDGAQAADVQQGDGGRTSAVTEHRFTSVDASLTTKTPPLSW